MNIRNPLAAALLLMSASNAPAQGIEAVNLGMTLYSMFGGGSAGPAGPAGAVDDTIFTCEPKCTTNQLNKREAIRTSRTCPQPASKLCINFLMEQDKSAQAAVELLGTNAPQDLAAAKKAGEDQVCKVPAELVPKEEQNQMIDPNRKQKQTPGEFQKTLESMQATYPNAIDLGGQRYGVPSEDGATMAVCGMSGCETRPIGEFADAIQLAKADANNVSINADNLAGQPKPPKPFSATSAPVKLTAQTSGATTVPSVTLPEASPNGDASPDETARDIGGQIARLQSSFTTGDGSGSDSSGNDDGLAGGPSAHAPDNSVQYMNGKDIDAAKVVLTYKQLQQNETDLNQTGERFRSNKIDNFASTAEGPAADAGNPQPIGTSVGSNSGN